MKNYKILKALFDYHIKKSEEGKTDNFFKFLYKSKEI